MTLRARGSSCSRTMLVDPPALVSEVLTAMPPTISVGPKIVVPYVICDRLLEIPATALSPPRDNESRWLERAAY